MARVADSLFIGFAVNPEWDLMKPYNKDEVHIDLVLSRQFQQYPQLRAAVDKLLSIVRSDLCGHHILELESKLAALSLPPTHNLRVIVPNHFTCSSTHQNPPPSPVAVRASSITRPVAPTQANSQTLHPRQRPPVHATPLRNARGHLLPHLPPTQHTPDPVRSARASRPPAGYAAIQPLHSPPAKPLFEVALTPALAAARLRAPTYDELTAASAADRSSNVIVVTRPSTVVPVTTEADEDSDEYVTPPDSSSDDDDGDTHPVPTWIRTPAGSPEHESLSLPFNSIPEDDPPGYAELYVSAELWNPFPFAPVISDFVLELALSPRAIAQISDALSYEPHNWVRLFIAAGVNYDNAVLLEAIILDALPLDYQTAFTNSH